MKKMFLVFLVTLFICSSNIVFAGGPNRVRGNGGQAYGCVTANTMVTLATGEKIRIDSLSTEHSVLNQLSEEVNVLYTLAGPEKIAMYKIETVSGKTIEATEGHPFYSKNGVLAAKKFKANDKILTVDGLEAITSIKLFNYDGLVYNMALVSLEYANNLSVERIDPFLGLRSQEHTVILNGFISGDIIIQRLIAN